jgi:hypothetical protein
VLSDRRGPLIVPSHGCAALTQPARRVASLYPTSVWETASPARNMGSGVGVCTVVTVVEVTKLWNVPSVVVPEQTTALGVRAAEGSLGDKL